MTDLNDIVLIYLEDTPVSFARVESILPDHKKDWFQLKLLMLQIPLQTVVWILKDEYINGTPFHMNQKRMRLEKVVCPVEALPPADTQPSDSVSGTRVTQEENDRPFSRTGRVISLSDFKKKQE